MTRQEVVIKVSKISRIIGELKYEMNLGGKIEFAALDPDFAHIAEWIKEIHQYIEEEPSPVLYRLVENIGFTDIIEDYLSSHAENIDAPSADLLEKYVKGMHALTRLCDSRRTEQKGKYTDLTETLANKEVATLLDRAVDAGLLDSHYQPTPKAKSVNLKIIAYAVSTLCKLSHPYSHFEKQWHKEKGNRFSTSRLPKRDTSYYDSTKALYPEVDFSNFEVAHEIDTLYTPQSEQDIKNLYMELVKYGYIAPDTPLEAFYGIFNKERFKQPIEWIKNQRQLAFLLYTAFSTYNKQNLWIKGECCFRINGRVPHRACFVSGYSQIKRDGLLDAYDVRLKSICDRFNHIDTPEASPTTSETQRLIHTSKLVFHSTADEKKKFAMYSALIQGEYIAADTTFAIFKGIFDETEFSTPVKWIKKQAQLMYFVYLAFKKDNPFDIWVKSVYCFCMANGKKPNRESLHCNFRNFIQKGILDTYDTELKNIADSYVYNNDL